MDFIYSITAIVDIGLLFAMVWLAARIYLTFRGTRRVVCPTAHKTGILRIAASRAASPIGGLGVERCSLWPQWQHCDRECLAQIQRAGDGCRLDRYLSDWCEGKACALCGKRFEQVRFALDKPALMGDDGVTHEWEDLAWRDPNLPLGYRPVCWSCHLRATFARAGHDREPARSERQGAKP